MRKHFHRAHWIELCVCRLVFAGVCMHVGATGRVFHRGATVAGFPVSFDRFIFINPQ